MYNKDFLKTLIGRNTIMTTAAMMMYDCQSGNADSLQDCLGDSYFNQVNIDSAGMIQVGDILLIVTSNGAGNFTISAVSPNVTLIPYVPSWPKP